jgi:hypothetical protein
MTFGAYALWKMKTIPPEIKLATVVQQLAGISWQNICQWHGCVAHMLGSKTDTKIAQ